MTWHNLATIGFAFVGVCSFSLIVTMLCENGDRIVAAWMQEKSRASGYTTTLSSSTEPKVSALRVSIADANSYERTGHE